MCSHRIVWLKTGNFGNRRTCSRSSWWKFLLKRAPTAAAEAARWRAGSDAPLQIELVQRWQRLRLGCPGLHESLYEHQRRGTLWALRRGGRVLVVSGEPRSPSGQAGSRLPLASQDVVVVEAEEGQVDSRSHGDIPRDRSGKGRAGFRLPLPEIEDDFVVVESAVGEERSGGDIPRDGSGSGRAGFRLPLPEEEDLLAVVVDNRVPARLLLQELLALL